MEIGRWRGRGGQGDNQHPVPPPQATACAMKEGREMPPQKDKEEAVEKMMTNLRKSSRTLERPMWMKEEVKTFVAMVEINSQKAVALLDLGHMTDVISPKMVQIAGLKVHQLVEQVPIQLGTKGSKS